MVEKGKKQIPQPVGWVGKWMGGEGTSEWADGVRGHKGGQAGAQTLTCRMAARQLVAGQTSGKVPVPPCSVTPMAPKPVW